MSRKLCAQDGAGNPVDCGLKLHAQKRCKNHYQQWHRLQPKCKADGCKRLQAGHFYCRPHERLSMSLRSEAAQRRTLAKFLAQIEPDPETGCWLWTGGTNPKGYGTFSTNGSWLAHRFAYVWFCGGHAPRKVLDHLCDVNRCVRPDHVWPIANTYNLRLMHERAGATDKEFWRDARFTPHILSMIAWAIENDLPHTKPTPPERPVKALKTLKRLQLGQAA
ncbi:hypothetical protein ASF74_03445 [Arthrobacter sp. Leaf145]|nr:hypothetical protein ASF74_03445 [Arthrobacter sp. Leaf145]